MAYKRYKFSFSAPSAANKVISKEFQPDEDEANSFRISEIILQAITRDAIATGDQIIFQISTKDQSGEASLYNLDSEYEVWTKALLNTFTQMDNPNDTFENTDIAKWIKDKSRMDIILRSGKKYYFNLLITGQAGATPTAVHCVLVAQYQDVADPEGLKEAHSIEI